MNKCDTDLLKRWQNADRLPMCNSKIYLSPTQKADCVAGVEHALCMLYQTQCKADDAVCSLIPNYLQQMYCRQAIVGYHRTTTGS